MGSAYPTIAADAIARFQRMQGKRVTFITGTDEHGEKIALAAQSRGMAPKEHCDDIVSSYKDLWNKVCPATFHINTIIKVQRITKLVQKRSYTVFFFLPFFCSWISSTTHSFVPPTRSTKLLYPRYLTECGTKEMYIELLMKGITAWIVRNIKMKLKWTLVSSR